MGLTSMQRRFAEFYAGGESATKAAVKAGYSERGAGATGHHLLKNPKVSAHVRELQEAARSSTVMELRECLEKLTAMARANAGDYLTLDGGIDIERIKEHFPEAVQGIDMTERVNREGEVVRRVRLRLADKVRVLERLAKLLRWEAADTQSEGVTFILPEGVKLEGTEFERKQQNGSEGG